MAICRRFLPRRRQSGTLHSWPIFERAFLRLVREFRNQRRVFAGLVVAGGLVNITDGPQQVNN